METDPKFDLSGGNAPSALPRSSLLYLKTQIKQNQTTTRTCKVRVVESITLNYDTSEVSDWFAILAGYW